LLSVQLVKTSIPPILVSNLTGFYNTSTWSSKANFHNKKDLTHLIEVPVQHQKDLDSNQRMVLILNFKLQVWGIGLRFRQSQLIAFHLISLK
jgi:hypothetical protein